MEYWKRRATVDPREEFERLLLMEESREYTPDDRAAAWRQYVTHFDSSNSNMARAQERLQFWENLLRRYDNNGWSYIDINLSDNTTITMVYIQPGTFNIGASSEERGFGPHDGPVSRVQITHGYSMGITPITQNQYELVMGVNPSNFTSGQTGNHPVERVSWNDAVEFCERLSIITGLQIALPTEAQWEYAARAGTSTPYHFGDNSSGIFSRRNARLEDYAWFGDNSGRTTHPVRQKLPNQWGLYDMHGNVYEWTSSIWQNNHPGGSNIIGRTCPVTAHESRERYRTVRGGSYLCDETRLRSAYRQRQNRTLRSNSNIGFRIIAENISH